MAVGPALFSHHSHPRCPLGRWHRNFPRRFQASLLRPPSAPSAHMSKFINLRQTLMSYILPASTCVSVFDAYFNVFSEF